MSETDKEQTLNLGTLVQSGQNWCLYSLAWCPLGFILVALKYEQDVFCDGVEWWLEMVSYIQNHILRYFWCNGAASGKLHLPSWDQAQPVLMQAESPHENALNFKDPDSHWIKILFYLFFFPQLERLNLTQRLGIGNLVKEGGVKQGVNALGR